MRQPAKPARRLGVIPVLVLSALTLAPLGCGSSSSMNPVKGEIFVNGQPAAGAEVVFYPINPGEKKYFPAATVEPDGSFRLTTKRADDGAPEGEYRISVLWCDTRREEGETLYSPDKLNYRYYDPAYSGLTATIKPGINELPRFNLE